jgi:hypothetical protein
VGHLDSVSIQANGSTWLSSLLIRRLCCSWDMSSCSALFTYCTGSTHIKKEQQRHQHNRSTVPCWRLHLQWQAYGAWKHRHCPIDKHPSLAAPCCLHRRLLNHKCWCTARLLAGDEQCHKARMSCLMHSRARTMPAWHHQSHVLLTS